MKFAGIDNEKYLTQEEEDAFWKEIQKRELPKSLEFYLMEMARKSMSGEKLIRADKKIFDDFNEWNKTEI